MLRQAQFIYSQTCSNNVQLDNIYYKYVCIYAYKKCFSLFCTRCFSCISHRVGEFACASSSLVSLESGQVFQLKLRNNFMIVFNI